MLWMLVFAIPLAFLLNASVAVIPANQRRVAPRLGFLLIVPALLSLVTLTPLTALSFFMVTAGSLAVYYVIRTVAVLGLDASYRAVSQHFNMTLSPGYTYLGWLLAFVEPFLMLALFVYALFTNKPGNPLTARGMGEVIQLVTMIIAAGLGLSYLYFMGMFGNRKRILQRAPQPKGTVIQKKDGSKASPGTNIPPPKKSSAHK